MRKKNSKDKKIMNILSNQKGMALLTTLIFVFILVTFAVSLLIMTSNDTRLSALQRDSTKAFFIAEAGIERTLYNLKEDFEISRDWNDNFVEGTLYDEIDFGDGKYTVYLSNLTSNTVTVKSKGVVYNKSTRYVQVDVEIENVSVWNNTICGGSGASGNVINANVDFRGSVHILGEDLEEGDIALSMKGDAKIGNNYEGIDTTTFTGKYPALPTTEEGLETLNATLRIKKGKLVLEGSATVGEPNNDDNFYKETVNGIYVNDKPIEGTDNIYSDNGVENDYDLGNVAIEFPSLLDPYTDPVTGEEYLTYKAYLVAVGLTPGFTINEISSEIGKFWYPPNSEDVPPIELETPPENYIYWDQVNSTLTVQGIIIINCDDDDLGLDIGKLNDNIEFIGKGTLVSLDSTKDIFIHSNLLSEGVFPDDDALGFISANNINISTGGGEANLRLMGAYYAENMIKIAKQTQLVGSIVSNDFDMGDQTPKMFQFPTLAEHLPPGMPGAAITYYIYTNNWHEVHE